ncbi:hypothetical protein [Pontibacter fetidus]|uniref:Beta-lactamase-inhibitor-like PepSY-like domain-containing protein n=1 Tax=Pontibacter fetidus TaxID=2700082 RepID=A0A6B2H1P3_9BACT|nr:hypothetical protein [Pontibacter fetidus]NDK56048.1 hypothetical protein [Pontibacter fetidus]
MRAKTYFTSLLLLVLISCKVQGQELSKKDTELYILFNTVENRRYDSKIVVPKTLEERWEVQYLFANSDFKKSRLYDGYPLQFITKDKREAKTITNQELKKLPVVTIEQLHKFISENYKGGEESGYYGGSYFNNLKHIYLVEKDEKTKTATITEVKPDITIE